MLKLNPQAEELNKVIQHYNPQIYEMLSQRGRLIYFPKKGMIAQGIDAKGKEINATIGVALEDNGSPLRLLSVAQKIKLNPNDVFPYATSFGKQELREKWQKMLYKKNPTLRENSISLPLVTNAITHGLSIAGYLFLDEGDSIILPDLFWGNYKLIFSNAYGAQLTFFPFFKNDKLNIEGLDEMINRGSVGKKIILLNFPNNPTGYTPTIHEAKQLMNVLIKSAAAGNKLVVFFDDAYFGLVYLDDVYRESLFAEIANAHPNILAIKLDGATKEDYVWGFRVGFITYGTQKNSFELFEALELKTAGAIRGSISNASHLSQSLLINSYNSDTYEKEKREKYQLLKERFEMVRKILDDHQEYKQYFSSIPFNSGYFMCIKLKGLEGEKIRQILLKRYNTGVVAIQNMLRIAYASTPTNKIELLFENIYKACKEVG